MSNFMDNMCRKLLGVLLCILITTGCYFALVLQTEISAGKNDQENRGFETIQPPNRSIGPDLIVNESDVVQFNATGKVLFDAAHNNPHVAYSILKNNLKNEGYDVVINYNGISNSTLASVKVLILAISYLTTAYSPNEIDCIENFVRNGGGLLLMTDINSSTYDHQQNATPIANRFNLNFIPYIDLSTHYINTLHPVTVGVDSVITDPYAGGIDTSGSNSEHILWSNEGVFFAAISEGNAETQYGRLMVSSELNLFANMGMTSAPMDPNDNDENEILASNTIAWLYNRPITVGFSWDFDARVDSDGDGNYTNDKDATEQAPTHIYADNGVYTVTLTMKNESDVITNETINVTVLNVNPDVKICNSGSGLIGIPISFSANAYDPGSDDLTFIWNWSDGTPNNVTTYYNNGITPDPYPSPEGTYPFFANDTVTHIYEKPGLYNITLMVIDDDGGETTNITMVRVLAPDLIPWDVQINNIPYSAPVYISLGNNVDFSAKVKNVGNANATNWCSIDLSDSTTTLSSIEVKGLNINQISLETLTYIWTPSTIGIYFFNVTVDLPSNNIIESNETNNMFQIKIIVIAPDLIPWDIQIDNKPYTGPVHVMLGSHVGFSVRAKNIGGGNATNWFYLNLTDSKILSSVLIKGLNINQISTKILEYIWTPSTAGVYLLNVTVDLPGNNVIESNETNNAYQITIIVKAPDLIPWDVKVNGKLYTEPVQIPLGSSIQFSAKANNIGTVDIIDRFYLNLTNSITSLNLVEINGLNSNQISRETLTYTWNASIAGTNFFNITVDSTHLINELNEFNNIFMIKIIISNLPITCINYSPPYYTNPSTGILYVNSLTNFTLTPQDYSGTGIRSTYYRIDNSSWINYTAIPSKTFNIMSDENDGPHKIYFYSIDYLNGKETINEFQVWLDNTPPLTNIYPNKKEVRLNTEFNLTVVDENGSGVKVSYYKIDGEKDSEWILYMNGFQITDYGWYTIEYYSIDNLNNSEEKNKLEINIFNEKRDVNPNYKPILALIFAIILMICGIIVGYKRPLRLTKSESQESQVQEVLLSKDRFYSCLLLALPFCLIEIITGIISGFTGALSIPPWFGAGLFVDTMILMIGLIVDGWCMIKKENISK